MKLVFTEKTDNSYSYRFSETENTLEELLETGLSMYTVGNTTFLKGFPQIRDSS